MLFRLMTWSVVVEVDRHAFSAIPKDLDFRSLDFSHDEKNKTKVDDNTSVGCEAAVHHSSGVLSFCVTTTPSFPVVSFSLLS